MPFVRFSRDKRGYEHIYLVHAPQGRGRPGPAKVLYWYRTPPGVRVGREPFDANVQRALEAEYPNLQFDWKRIVNTPMPPPEGENWREKRRLMKEMRAARAEEEREVHGAEATAGQNTAGGLADDVPVETVAEAAVEDGLVSGSDPAEAPRANGGAAPSGAPGEERRRRRRRGGRRRRRGLAGAQPPPSATSAVSDPTSEPASESVSESYSGSESESESKSESESESKSESESESVSKAELDFEQDPSDQE